MSGHASPSLLLNDEQRMLAKTAHEFIQEHASAGRLRTFRDTKDEFGFSRDLWNEMAELGWLGLQIPEEYDGLGLGFFDLCVVLEESGRDVIGALFGKFFRHGETTLPELVASACTQVFAPRASGKDD